MGGSLVFLFLAWHLPSVAAAMMAGRWTNGARVESAAVSTTAARVAGAGPAQDANVRPSAEAATPPNTPVGLSGQNSE